MLFRSYEGLGEISDVCLKRKIRNRMMDLGQNVVVQSDEMCIRDRCEINLIVKRETAQIYS